MRRKPSLRILWLPEDSCQRFQAPATPLPAQRTVQDVIVTSTQLLRALNSTDTSIDHRRRLCKSRQSTLALFPPHSAAHLRKIDRLHYR